MTPELFRTITISFGVFAVVTAVALAVRSAFLRLLHRWAEKTETELDNLFVNALRLPSISWAVAVGLYFGIAASPLPDPYVAYLTRGIHVLLILSVTVAVANIAARMATYGIGKAKLSLPMTGLSQAIIKGSILTIGALVLLGTLGVSITPLITALGVGGLAVALALQDSLSNFFAGIHILVEQPIRVGDFIRLESGQEGYVTDIGWRTTRIRMLPNNVVIIPNNKLSQSILTNYYLPETRMSLPIPIGVGYDADPDHVERVLIEEATQAAQEVPGLLADPAPAVRFIPGFVDSSLNFTLVCQVREFTDQFPVQHELRKRIFKRFRKEGIEIPFPIRTVYLHQVNGKTPAGEGQDNGAERKEMKGEDRTGG